MEEDMGIFRRLISATEGGQSYPFIIRITTTAANTVFTLPLVDYGSFTPLLAVNWGDGNSSPTISSSTSLDRIHTYVTPGTYNITIAGFMPGFKVNNNSGIRSLIVALIQWGTVGLRTVDFYGCSNLTSIPGSSSLSLVGGYTGLSEVISFAGIFRNSGLTSIPSDLFAYSPYATTFSNAFANTPITSVPSTLFTNNLDAQDFSSCFSACTSLTTVPVTLFDANVNAVNFSSTFRNCLSLATCLQFTYNTNATVFSNVYNMSTTSNLLTGTAPTLWTRVPTPTGTAAFRNCTGLTNYASIPTTFK